MTALKTQAINTALMGDWNSAITLNIELLKSNPNDIETLNRLAFAYCVNGKIKEAKQAYQKVLKLDSCNPIALKGVKRLTSTDKRQSFDPHQSLYGSGNIDSLFLEETGKTKVIELVNVAEPKIVVHLMCGELLFLRIKRLKIFALDPKNKYIGMLPDNIGKRLLKFIKGGNSYQAYVKAVEGHSVTIFIKEVKRANRFKNQPSFATGESVKNIVSKKGYTPKESEESEEG